MIFAKFGNAGLHAAGAHSPGPSLRMHSKALIPVTSYADGAYPHPRAAAVGLARSLRLFFLSLFTYCGKPLLRFFSSRISPTWSFLHKRRDAVAARIRQIKAFSRSVLAVLRFCRREIREEGWGHWLQRRCGEYAVRVRQIRPGPVCHAACCSVLLLVAISLISSLLLVTPHYHVAGNYARLPALAQYLDAGSLPDRERTVFPFTTAIRPAKTPDLQPAAHVYRASVIRRHASPILFAAADSPASGHRAASGLVVFHQGLVSVRTFDGYAALAGLGQFGAARNSPPHHPLESDMFSASGASLALLYGEEMDGSGLPVRWSWREADYLVQTVRECAAGNKDKQYAERRMAIRNLGFPVPDARFGGRGDKYKDFIQLYAQKYDLAAPLMLAIMHTESGFNPHAVSRRQAVGLMQIVPGTAGNEVFRFLMGTHGTPSPDSLFNPENNIKYGAVYLHLLERSYFGGVTSKAARQMCVIAAYNGGPNAVLNLFDYTKEGAIERINAMSPEQVYVTLISDMPQQETRRYVERVVGKMRSYLLHN